MRGWFERLIAGRRSAAARARRESFTAEELRTRLGYDVAAMIANGHDAAIVGEQVAFNANVDRFVDHPVFGRYLRSHLPAEAYETSGVWVLAIKDVAAEIRELEPGTTLLSIGYFPIARSNAGNLICFEAASNRVWWASHELLSDDDPTSGLTPVADELWAFVRALDADLLTDRLAALDRGGSSS
jgi:hypothetical protein